MTKFTIVSWYYIDEISHFSPQQIDRIRDFSVKFSIFSASISEIWNSWNVNIYSLHKLVDKMCVFVLLLFSYSDWLAKMMIFINNQLTNFAIFICDRPINKICKFFQSSIDEIHNFFHIRLTKVLIFYCGWVTNFGTLEFLEMLDPWSPQAEWRNLQFFCAWSMKLVIFFFCSRWTKFFYFSCDQLAKFIIFSLATDLWNLQFWNFQRYCHLWSPWAAKINPS